MSATLPARFGVLQRRNSLLYAAGVGTACIAVGIVGARFEPPPHGRWLLLVVSNVAVEVGFAVAALLLAREPGQGKTAALLGCAAACELAGASQAAQPNPLNFLGVVIGPMFWVFAGWALLRFPFNRVSQRSERVFLLVSAVWLGAGHTAANLTLDPRWYPDRWSPRTWWPTVVDSKSLYTNLQILVVSIDAALAFWYLVLIARRMRRLSGVDRWILAPMAASIAAAAMPLLLRPPAFVFDLTSVQRALELMMSAVLLLIPLAFVIVLVRQRFTRSVIADMVTSLTSQVSTRSVADALRKALRDPTLEVAYWVADTGQYVDAAGRPAEVDDSKLQVPITGTDGKPLGVIVADPALRNHRPLVDAAVSASRLALENAQLQAALQAQLDEVKASRRRATEAGVAERRRLERDLHDGVQQRLLALTLRLSEMGARNLDAQSVIDRARAELHAALGELRELARGIHPSVLAQSGLGAALEDLVDRLPFPVTLFVSPRRWPPAIEGVTYFIVCEALSNVVKHAEASSASVQIIDKERCMEIAIIDNGRGGADPSAGTGIAGIGDRIRALNGTLDVSSPVGGGTSLRMELPCG